MTTWPAASTPCTWKTDLAMSRPIVVIVCIVSSSPNRGSFNSAHIRGTHVPVEEPSTASTTEVAVASFNHLVGTAQQRLGNSKAQHLGRLEIDDHLDFRSTLHRQIGGFRALENLTGVDAH